MKKPVVRARDMRLSEAEHIPTSIGQVVRLAGGGAWGIVVDVDGPTCTVAYRDQTEELVAPCAALRQVRQ